MSVSVRPWGDPTTWNRFVASVPHAHFQQSWEWGELASDLGGNAVRLAAVRGSAVVGAMQIFVNGSGFPGRTLLYVPRGPALLESSAQVLGPLLDAARAVGMERRSLGIRLEPNVPQRDDCLRQLLTSFGFHPSYPPSQPRSSWMLDISASHDELLAQMKSKTRYNIRLAARKGVEVSRATLDDLSELYDLYLETAQRDDLFVHPESLYRRMFDLFERANRFAMIFARHNGRLIAAVTLIHMGDTCWYLHGASSNEHRNLMATYLLQWEGIKCAKSWGCRLYDFRAVPDLLREDQDMYGVYRFKEGFGGHHFTTMDTYAQAYAPGLFGVWQTYFSGRFALQAMRRRHAGLPARQFA